MSRFNKLLSALLIAALMALSLTAVGEPFDEAAIVPEESTAIEAIEAPEAEAIEDAADADDIVAEAAEVPVAERPEFELGDPEDGEEIIAAESNAALALTFCPEAALLKVGESCSLWQLFQPVGEQTALTADDVEVAIADTAILRLEATGSLSALAPGETSIRVTLPNGAFSEGVVSVAEADDIIVRYIGDTPERYYDGTDAFSLDAADFLLDSESLELGFSVKTVLATADGAGVGSHRLEVALTIGDVDDWCLRKSLTLEASIAPLPLSELPGAGDFLALESECTYTGAPICPAVRGLQMGDAALREGTDYTVEYADNVAPGVARAVVQGIGNYTGTLEATFGILPVDIIESGIAAALDAVRGAEYPLSDEPVCPDFTLSYNGAELVKDVDYTVSFEGNQAPGVAVMTVAGIGGFTGSIDIPFIVLDDLPLAAAASVIPESIELGVSETFQLPVPDGGAQFASANKKIASVSAKGVIKGVKKGNTNIGVKDSDGRVTMVAVTVKPAPSKVALSDKKLTMIVGQTNTLAWKFSPADCRNRYTWLSSNDSVARVVNGTIAALKPGKATITLKTYNNKSAKCTVTVYAAPTGVTLDRTSADLYTKATLTLKAAVSPAGALSTIQYTSSNSAVATVNAKGKVTAKAPGETTITVQTVNGKTASCTIRVIKAPSKVLISQKSATLIVGSSLQLSATTDTEDHPALAWSTSNKKVATVSPTGYVTTLKAGSVTITAKTANGKKASCKIAVKALPKSVTVKAAKTKLKVGQTTKATATLTKNSYSPIEWSVEGDAVTVDQSGVITAVKPGYATVLATATAAYIAGSVTITVFGDPTADSDQPQDGDKLIVDISKWNGNINFDKLKPKVSLVICRASCALNIDVKFESYAASMNAKGIPFGVYCYSHATDAASARLEARYFYACAAKYKPRFFVLDAEEASLTQEAIIAFASELRGLGARKVGVYVAHNRYNQYGMGSARSKFDFVWIPRYGKNDGTIAGATKPAYPCDMWQYSSKGKVAGISGNVDVNVLTGQGRSLSWFVS